MKREISDCTPVLAQKGLSGLELAHSALSRSGIETHPASGAVEEFLAQCCDMMARRQVGCRPARGLSAWDSGPKPASPAQFI